MTKEKFKTMMQNEVKDMLKPEGYEYVLVTHIAPGDYVRWYNNDALVKMVDVKGNEAYITVVDPLDGKDREFKYKTTDELIVKIGTVQ